MSGKEHGILLAIFTISSRDDGEIASDLTISLVIYL
jgi:hypothetical protein